MKVFITGGSGLIGSYIVEQLVAAGHTVTSLARSDASASKLTSLGATPVRGTHTELSILAENAAAADAVIHCAFNHGIFLQPNGIVQANEEDRAAITAMCDALVSSGSGKTFINSSGLISNIAGDEFSAKAEGPHALRALSEKILLGYSERGIRTINIRLATIVHSATSEHPFITGQIAAAKKNGFVGYVGEGSNVWPAVHAKDAGALYALALTSDKIKSGSNLNGIAEGGVQRRRLPSSLQRRWVWRRRAFHLQMPWLTLASLVSFFKRGGTSRTVIQRSGLVGNQLDRTCLKIWKTTVIKWNVK
ncbi:hypothetical protein DL96DRAFT_415039 [Flagelloscypha sp. PMI_526]|nr:hypothetical protein DL96DRAFT_415039 [Flagelloscypha sp. PMI_526]